MKRLLAVLVWPRARGVRADLPGEEPDVLAGRFRPGGNPTSREAPAVRAQKKCPAIETIIQYKPGVGGAVMWNQMNALPGDG